MKIVVTGMIATYPVGGVVWDYAQYALGLERLGHEVFYLEDTGWKTYDPMQGSYDEDCSFGVNFLEKELGRLSPSLSKRWHFRSMDGKSYGMAQNDIEAIVADADVFLNVSGSCLLRDEYMRASRKVLIDTDPGLNHFVNYPKWDKGHGWTGMHSYREHDYFFTYAENIGQPDCLLPALGLDWKKTRPLVVMDLWKAQEPSEKWTTIMTWNNFPKPIEYEGKVYGSKEMEFGRIESLPGKVSAKLEMAVGGQSLRREEWRQLGWSVLDSQIISRTAADYQQYVQSSRGEFSVAKNVYVATRCGWFSCRSICYMAAGRPVVLQDTGFSKFIPTGSGVLLFSNLDEAVGAIKEVEGNYEHHSNESRRIARDYFSSEVVLHKMFNEIGL